MRPVRRMMVIAFGLTFFVSSLGAGAGAIEGASDGAGEGTVVVGEPFRPTSIENQIDFRAALALSTDPHLVASVQNNPDAVLTDTGLWVTKTEAIELEARTRLESDLEDAFDALTGFEGYAGAYIDHEAGGELAVLVTAAGFGAVQDWVATASFREPSRVRVDVVEYSHAELLEAMREVESATAGRTVITSYALSEPGNRVLVTVDPTQAGLVASEIPVSKEQLPPGIASDLKHPAVVVWASEINDAPATTMVGGFSWNFTGAGAARYCTLGFEVNDNSVGPAMLTAGHCLDNDPVSEPNPGDPLYFTSQHIGWFQGEYDLGCPSNVGICVDAGIIELINGATATDNVRGNGVDLDVAGTSLNWSTGVTRCFYGWNSGYVCGTITCSTLNYLSDGGRWYRDMVTTSNLTDGGDSGAPLYRVSGSSAYAAGVVRGDITGQPCFRGTDAVHSKIDDVLAGLQATLVTTN